VHCSRELRARSDHQDVHAEEFDDIHLKLVPLGDSAVLMPSDGV
jgi:hypothetical protein